MGFFNRKKKKKDEHVIKIILLGNTGSGKSTFLFSLVNGRPPSREELARIEKNSFFLKPMRVGDEEYRVQVWNIASDTDKLPKACRDYDSAIILSSLSASSLERNIDHWDDLIEKTAGKNVFRIHVGSKKDQAITFEQQACAHNPDISNRRTVPMLRYFEVEQTDLESINTVFNAAVNEILRLRKEVVAEHKAQRFGR